MKARKYVVSALAGGLLVALCGSGLANAEPMDMPMMGPMGEHGPAMGMGSMDSMDMMDQMMGMCLRHADQIGLTEDQVAKMKPLHNEMEKKQARFKADRKIAEIDMKEIMEVKDFDLEKANAAVRKIADIKTAHQLEMLKSMKEVRTLLTEEQFRKMEKMMPMMMGEKQSHEKGTMKRKK